MYIAINLNKIKAIITPKAPLIKKKASPTYPYPLTLIA
jgi:hypothetical protein